MWYTTHCVVSTARCRHFRFISRFTSISVRQTRTTESKEVWLKHKWTGEWTKIHLNEHTGRVTEERPVKKDHKQNTNERETRPLKRWRESYVSTLKEDEQITVRRKQKAAYREKGRYYHIIVTSTISCIVIVLLIVLTLNFFYWNGHILRVLHFFLERIASIGESEDIFMYMGCKVYQGQ